jgi:hypothetical protein
MSDAAHRRRALLAAALGFPQLPQQTPALRALHVWLDNWRGVGLFVEGMRRQGYRVSLREDRRLGRKLPPRSDGECRLLRVGSDALGSGAARPWVVRRGAGGRRDPTPAPRRANYSTWNGGVKEPMAEPVVVATG